MKNRQGCRESLKCFFVLPCQLTYLIASVVAMSCQIGLINSLTSVTNILLFIVILSFQCQQWDFINVVDNYRHTRLMPCSLGLPLACRPCSLQIVEQGHFGGSYLISSLWSLLSHQRIWALRGETQVETWLNLPHLFITLDYVKILVYFSPLFLVKKGTFPLSSWIRY